ncbi:macrolide export ATP-binding/permease protein MacB 2-like [Bactrocera neohumeralis]|uniref:macrolide export ATP-binding/permease protein MacB 2-like n=1 Tax=Bactrocera neohumeralis TaxID=98809 RepID=UPI0021661E18|nr:macrolide export ATP-binding/permease protein MacB 2-like [Bactrocera neohumeralis]
MAAAAKQYGVLTALVRDTHGQLAPALGNAVLAFVDWFLPLFTSVYGAHMAAWCHDTAPAAASSRLLDATHAVKAGVEALFDAHRVISVVLTNGYKAGVIERILSPRFWESTTSEDIDRVGAYARAHSWDDAVVRPPPVALYRHLAHQHADTLRAASAAAHSKRTYEHLMVTHLSVRNLQLPIRRTRRCTDGGDDSCSPIKLHLAYKSVTPSSVANAPADGEGSGTTQQPPLLRSRGGEEEEEEEAYPVNLRDIPCSVLRGELFSYVPQYPSIFSGASIAHNISLAPFVSLEETALLAKAQTCAEEARCDYIHRFPQGLLTPVGDASSLWSGSGPADGTGLVRLSGGQSQRLMVARALYHGGSILLMDEPTASLDSLTKTELLKEWRQLLDRGVIKGILCASHDEAVVAAADEVVSLA